MSDLLHRQNNLRRVRVETRKRIEAAASITDPTDRRNRIAEQQAMLRGTEREWQQIKRDLAVEQGLMATRQAPRPVARTVARSTARGYLTRALGA